MLRLLCFYFQTLVTTLDKICVAVDNEDILRSRCEAKQTFDQRFYVKDDEIIDCDVYITDGSGDDLGNVTMST